MDAIDYLREEIKSYFPESSELLLAASFAQQRRFNFYFEIKAGSRFLLYLNWDGEYDRFILKCLEFTEAEILNGLIKAYPEIGSKSFNIGQPRSTVSFIYRDQNKLTVLDLKGSIHAEIDSNEISGLKLMQCIDPGFSGIS